MVQPLKLASGLGLVNEIMLRTFHLKPSHHSCIIHRSQAISSFFHHSSIDQSQVLVVYPHELDSHLGPANEMMLRAFDFKSSHHFSIIHPSIRARFIWCTLINLTSGLDLATEIMLS